MTTPSSARSGRHATSFSTPSDREVVAVRTFDAPRRLVWDAHTKTEHLPRWMTGPEGWVMPICEIDLRPGGAWRYGWSKADGSEPFEMTGTFTEIAAPERLVYTERWGPDWPEAVNTLVLVEKDGRTTLTCTVVYPSKEARDQALATGMTDGWGTSYDRLDEHLRAVGGAMGA